MKKLCSILLISALASPSFAGVYELTHHSRANCVGFNETVSWYAGHHYWFWVVSRHRNAEKKADHQVIADWAWTWRAAAYHTNEGWGGWTVEGHHWGRSDMSSLPFEVTSEFIVDCSSYDGWWN